MSREVCARSIDTIEIHESTPFSHSKDPIQEVIRPGTMQNACVSSVTRLQVATEGVHVIHVRPMDRNSSQDPIGGSTQLTTLIGTLPEKHRVENVGSQV